MNWILVIIIAVLGIVTLNTTTQVTDNPSVSIDSVIPVEGTPEEELPAEKSRTVLGDALDLSGKQLTKVPSDVFERTSLVSLNLSNNRLNGALQAEVRHLKNLKVLDLSDNDFTGVPAEVGQLGELIELDLSNNNLTGLPHELGNLKNLQRMDLRGNSPSEYDLSVIRKSLSGTIILLD